MSDNSRAAGQRMLQECAAGSSCPSIVVKYRYSVPFFARYSSEHFDHEIALAERQYERAIASEDRVDPFGIYHWSPEDQGRRERATKKAALEYLGRILFLFIEACGSREFPGDQLLHQVNGMIGTLRRDSLQRKWPELMPRPAGDETIEREFDHALIEWLNGRKEWKEYEARVLPQPVGPTGDDLGDASPDPLRYFKSWQLENLPTGALTRMKAGLLEIHGSWLDRTSKRVDCWRRTYDLIADEFDQAHLLTEDLVAHRIPEIVADAVAGGVWSDEPLGRPQPTGIFSERFGSRFYPIWCQQALLDALEGRLSYWRGRLLLNPVAASPKPDGPRRGRKAKSSDHERVASIVASLEDDWTSDVNLTRLAEAMDLDHMEMDQRWHRDRIHLWVEALDHRHDKFVNAIKYRLKRAKAKKK